MMMIATALTLALLGFAMKLLGGLLRTEGPKIRAALQGRSWAARPTIVVRPASFSVRPTEPLPLRAAA